MNSETTSSAREVKREYASCLNPWLGTTTFAQFEARVVAGLEEYDRDTGSSLTSFYLEQSRDTSEFGSEIKKLIRARFTGLDKCSFTQTSQSEAEKTADACFSILPTTVDTEAYHSKFDGMHRSYEIDFYPKGECRDK